MTLEGGPGHGETIDIRHNVLIGEEFSLFYKDKVPITLYDTNPTYVETRTLVYRLSTPFVATYVRG